MGHRTDVTEDSLVNGQTPRQTNEAPKTDKPFVPPWRRRIAEQIAEKERQGRSRFEAVADITGIVAL